MTSVLTRACCDDADPATTQTKTFTAAIVGNPNCGKTTIFNALTGAKQHVANWPGVTVERKSGFLKYHQEVIEIIDLPGTYSLTVASLTSSIDERIACEYILNCEADVIIAIVDGSNLERNLYLTVQLVEMQVPMIVAVNMLDIARQRGHTIQLDQLQKQLGCPVVALEANKGKGIEQLKKMLIDKKFATPKLLTYSPILEQAIANIPAPYWYAIRLLEDDALAQQAIPDQSITVSEQQKILKEHFHEDADIVIADARYQAIEKLLQTCFIKSSQAITTWTERLDRLVLNRILGIPIFLAVMYSMFLFAINIGGAFQDFFDISSDTIFVQGVAQLLMNMHTPTWLIALLANGIGKGINTVVTFIPVIGAMFLFLAFLEDSGYMSRAAFVVDRAMRAIGLPGKSFVPMIVGFGCNVPAVMGARTLENRRDRILTIMMTPFMSCGARLAIYAVFTAAFFPVGGQNIVFALYLIGILMAVFTGFLLRKTYLKGDPAPLVMELPAYHVPQLKAVALHAWQRLKGFVFRAGKLIVPICILLGALNAFNVDGTINSGEGSAHSLLSTLGQFMTPVFAPMGIQQENWPATVGLLTGVLAKEVVIGTLNTIYSQIGHISILSSAGFDFWGGIKNAMMSVLMNLSQLSHSLGNPVLAQAPVHTLTQQVYGLMYQKFDGQIGAFAYLLFVLLYFPCVSTTAAMLRELNRGWAVFSVLWSTVVAYSVAVMFYQLATFVKHPLQSSLWVGGLLSVLVLGVSIMRFKNLAKQVPSPA